MTEIQQEPRKVAVAISYRIVNSSDPVPDEIQVCLVTSRKHSGKWVLPKGGIEKGENVQQAAIRELREEAGLVPSQIQPSFPLSQIDLTHLTVQDHKPYKLCTSDFVPRAVYFAVPLLIDSNPDNQVGIDWLEEGERQRQWFPIRKALEQIEWRPDIATLLRYWMAGIPNQKLEQN